MTFGQLDLLTTDQLEKLLRAASDAAAQAMREMLGQIDQLGLEEQQQVRLCMNTTLTTASGFLSETPNFKTWALDHPTECQMAMARGAMLWSAQRLLEEVGPHQSAQSISATARKALDAHNCVQTCRTELQIRAGYQQGGWSAVVCHRPAPRTQARPARLAS